VIDILVAARYAGQTALEVRFERTQLGGEAGTVERSVTAKGKGEAMK
jgi:hypothetical protein